jgi:hypothetical protein
MRSLAFRRHQTRRIKKRIAQFWHYHLFCDSFSDEKEQKHRLGFLAATPAPCSCAMCGNPRRYEKSSRLTLQEKRFAINKE